MKQSSLNFLMNAGSSFAGAAAAIFDAIEACNGMFENSEAKGMAGKFDLGLAVSKFERGLSYWMASSGRNGRGRPACSSLE